MARQKLADLVVSIQAETARFRSDMEQAARATASMQAKTNRSLAVMERGFASAKRAVVGFAAGFVAFEGIRRTIEAATRAAMEAERIQLRLNNVYKATGGAVGIARDELDALAESTARGTLFDDDAVRAAIASMLVFKNVQGETFREGIALSADLAEFLGTDISDAAQQLGKALMAPGENLRALKEAGVDFSEAEIKMLQSMTETNRIAEAQGIILERLRGSIGGAAEGANTGLTGAVTSLEKSWGELMEELGDSVVLEQAAKTLQFFVDQARAGVGIIQDLAGAVGLGEDTSTPAERVAETMKELADARARLDDMKANDASLAVIAQQEELVLGLEAELEVRRKIAALKAGENVPVPGAGEPETSFATGEPTTRKNPTGGNPDFLDARNTRRAHIAEVGAEIADLNQQIDDFAQGVEDDLLRAQGAQAALLFKAAEQQKAALKELFEESGRSWTEYAEMAADIDRKLTADLIELSDERVEQARKEADERARIEREKAEEIRQIFSGSANELRNQMQSLSFDAKSIAIAFLGDLSAHFLNNAEGQIFDLFSGTTASGGGHPDFGGGGGFDFSSILGGIGDFLGFANGGSFDVGGGGGTDSQLVAFKATPGENVEVTPPGKKRGQAIVVNQTFNVNQGADAAAVNALRAMAADIKRSTIAAIVDGQRRTAGRMV